MNAKRLLSIIGAGMGAAVVLGMLAALPVQAGSGLIKITHSSTPCGNVVQPVSATSPKAQPTARQATPAEIQAAVLAHAPTQPAARRAVFIHR